jgi:predicted ATPase/class 3 adenylate cyclase
MLSAMSTWSGPELPTGTLTFLFTDVEGSSGPWETNPAAMRAVMARHDALLTQVFAHHDGVVVRPRGEGDSLFVVFIRASDAVAAALAGQRALRAEDWGELGPLRVRMGLHTGEADVRDGDYYGAAVNRTARIRAAGHGGQVLLSEATTKLVRGALPAGAALMDLGRHVLRGLDEPELIYQLTAAGLPNTFPPLTTLDARPNNLPLQLTSFIGREPELADVTVLVQEHRLVTLTGPGGSGKTRLALQLAAELVDRFPDGVWFVDLSGVSDPAGVVPAIAQVLSVVDSAGQPLAVALAAYLRHRHLLLVVDNFEQVLGAALVVYDLLREAPQLTVIVTSRTLLRVEGEYEYAVAPLPLPALRAVSDVDQLALNPAVQLFAQRARALQGDFRLTAENAATVGEICRRLDGLPLAIELAAARVKVLPPQQLLVRLERRLPLMTGGARSLPARQQTLRAAIAWSWDLLAPGEQTLLRRLAVFAGGWTVAAAETVCNSDGSLNVLLGLEALIDHSLVRPHAGESEPRFTMLATLREFALEELAAAGEAAALRQRHAAYISTLAGEIEATFWQSGHLLSDLLTPLDRERDNLLATLAWAVEQQATELGCELVGALRLWFYVRAPGEGRRWVDQVLALPGADVPSRARGLAHLSGGTIATAQFAIRAAVAFYEAAVADLRSVEDLPALSLALGALASFLPLEEGARSAACGAEALALAQAVGEPYLTGWVTTMVANAMVLQHGDLAVARAHLETALRAARTLGGRLAGAARPGLVGLGGPGPRSHGRGGRALRGGAAAGGAARRPQSPGVPLHPAGAAGQRGGRCPARRGGVAAGADADP